MDHIVTKADQTNHLVVSIQLCFCTCALIALTLRAAFRPHARSAGCLIYGVCLFICGLCSFLYTTRFAGVPIPLIRQLDHASIFLLIAGTYTPFATRDIVGLFGMRLLYWIWGLALAGITLRLFISTGHDGIFVLFYLAMGWVFVTALRSVTRHISKFSLTFLALGAITYSVGATIFALGVSAWTDMIWHCCVTSAAMLHFVAILGVLTPPAKPADTDSAAAAA